jgi:uncharacterized protein
MKHAYLVTGATGGLGKAIVLELARQGFHLVLTDLNPQPLDNLATAVSREFGIEIITLPCNLANESERDRLFRDLSTIDVTFVGLINVAGIDSEGEFTSRSIAKIRMMMNLNMASGAELIQNVVQYREPGMPFYVLNVASLAAFQPMPYKALYAASKRFLVQLTLGIREELKPYDIHVSVLCPAGMPTNPTTIECINVQGFVGRATTMNTSTVAMVALRQMRKGRAMIIPGWHNRFIGAVSSSLPATFIASLLQKKWSKALMRRCNTLQPKETHS